MHLLILVVDNNKMITANADLHQPITSKYIPTEIKYLLTNRNCNGAVKGVPGGVVRIGGLARDGVLFIWSCRYTL